MGGIRAYLGSNSGVWPAPNFHRSRGPLANEMLAFFMHDKALQMVGRNYGGSRNLGKA